jgi:hypothetical protein
MREDEAYPTLNVSKQNIKFTSGMERAPNAFFPMSAYVRICGSEITMPAKNFALQEMLVNRTISRGTVLYSMV